MDTQAVETPLQTAINSFHPRWMACVERAVKRASEKFPDSADLIAEGRLIVLRNGVEISGDTAEVQSLSSPGLLHQVGDRCDCDEFEVAPEHYCQHRFAVGIHQRAKQFYADGWLETPSQEIQRVAPAPRKPMRIPSEYIQRINNKDFVLYVGLLAMAHDRGLKSLKAYTTSITPELVIAQAEATFHDGSCFSEQGDATPDNVGKQVRQHFIRMALTRAKARTLRDACNVGMTAAEELE